jgi:CRP-like cAMP-binding protein
MQLALPGQSVHVTKENDAYRQSVHQREIDRRVGDLRKVELFARLQEEELRTVGAHLVDAPFAAGDIIYQQGDAAHWLYLLAAGQAEVWIDFPGQPRQLFRTIQAGQTFGERGVLTGEARRDTVIAKTDVFCYRLDQATLEDLIRSRPQIAEAVAEILWRREVAIDSFKSQFLDAPPADAPAPKSGMLDKIKAFLGL